MSMSNEERQALIDQLDASFKVMPKWVQTACKHSIGIVDDPVTTFCEACELATDSSLLMLRNDFEDNGDLVPAAPSKANAA